MRPLRRTASSVISLTVLASALSGRPAKRAKSWRPRKWRAALRILPTSSGTGTWWLARLVRGDRTGPLSICERVSSTCRHPSRIEASGNGAHPPHDYVARQVVVERPEEDFLRMLGARVEGHDLTPRVHSGVRAAGPLDPDSLACESMNGFSSSSCIERALAWYWNPW